MEPPLIIVAIYLRGERLQPERVSQVLSVQPSKSQKTGGLCYESRNVTAKIGIWALIAQTDSAIVSDHIDELLKKIGSPPRPLDEIDGVEEAYLDVFVGVEDENAMTVEFAIPKSQLKAVVGLGLCGHFTVS
jgi:hypothetical protein